MIRQALLLFMLGLAGPAWAATGNPGDTLQQERVAVEEKLEENPHHLVMAVNGMCCRNCTLGIGKKISLLDFIDTGALPKGGIVG